MENTNTYASRFSDMIKRIQADISLLSHFFLYYTNQEAQIEVT